MWARIKAAIAKFIGRQKDAAELNQLPPTPKASTPVPSKAVEPPVEIKKPWFTRAKGFFGSRETDSKFAAFMIPFWEKLFGLKFLSIVGSPRAWCGLFVAVMLFLSGAEYTKRGASAIAWDSYGQKIEWRTEGIPQGAVVRINHNGDCKSAANNHVTFADGDCAAIDLVLERVILQKGVSGKWEEVKFYMPKPGATFNGLGGNQSDQVKISTYAVSEICSVSWPPKFEKPPRVTKSLNCTSKQSGNESTR